jgi:D-alanyl-D-alanine carboxypeptidase
MKDSHTVQAVTLLHPKVRDGFTGFINDAEGALDITIRMVQGLRTFAQQQAIYDQGRTKPGPVVTKAKAGQSYHNYGLAADIVPFHPDLKTLDWEYNFKLLVPFAIKYGITWGGLFPSPDRDHFENKFHHSWQELLQLYQDERFIAGTNYVDI